MSNFMMMPPKISGSGEERTSKETTSFMGIVIGSNRFWYKLKIGGWKMFLISFLIFPVLTVFPLILCSNPQTIQSFLVDTIPASFNEGTNTNSRTSLIEKNTKLFKRTGRVITTIQKWVCSTAIFSFNNYWPFIDLT